MGKRVHTSRVCQKGIRSGVKEEPHGALPFPRSGKDQRSRANTIPRVEIVPTADVQLDRSLDTGDGRKSQ